MVWEEEGMESGGRARERHGNRSVWKRLFQRRGGLAGKWRVKGM